MNIKYIFDLVGSTAPITLFFSSIYFLRNSPNYLLFYTIGYGLNFLLNAILKILIKEPRPDDDNKVIEFMIYNGNRVGFDKYGMPSGHAQVCLFSLTFLTLVLNDPNISIFCAVLSLISLIQRYIYNNHTILQLIIGALVGTIFAYLIYFISKKYIIGKINCKKDDNFFLHLI